LNADSVIIIGNLEGESEKIIDSLLIQGKLKDDLLRLSAKTKKELASILIDPAVYHGRYATRSGFTTGQVFAIWKKASYSFVKVSLHTHDLLSYSNGAKELSYIDPNIVSKLEDFYERAGLNR